MLTEKLIPSTFSSAAVIVAHPDDETLWAGGIILQHTALKWWVISLCRAGDPDRAPRFFKVLQQIGAEGVMGDLNDGPEQQPLPEEVLTDTIMALLPRRHFNLMLTHHPNGEYTRHRRHEEIGRAVIQLWHANKLHADELWVFAYEDGGRAYCPRAVSDATIHYVLPRDIWEKKYALMTALYGFTKDSWEARATPAAEAFWRFTDKDAALAWLHRKTSI